MSKRSDEPPDLEALREKIIGLGERSFRKSYYPKLRQQLGELQRFRALLDQSGDAIFLLELPSGRLIDVNASACRQLLFSREKLLSLSLNDIAGQLPPATLDLLLQPGGPDGGDQAVLETMLLRSDGEKIPVEITLRPVTFGGFAYAVGAARDITERRRAEEKVRRSERRYRSLFTSIDEGFVLCGAVPDESHPVDFRLLEANPAFERMLGVTPGQIAGRRMQEVVPGLEDLWGEICRRVNRTGESERATRYVKELGCWFDISAVAQGENTLALIFNDVTERKLAEEKTAELLGQLQAIFEHIPIGIAYLDASFRFISANRSFGDLFSVPADELIGRACYETVGEYITDESRRGLEKICSFCKKDECIRLKEPTVIERPQGERILRVQTIPELNEEGEITRFLEIAEDITARKRLEQSLREGERRFREITESLPQLIWTTDGEGACDYLSRQWVEYTGIPAEEQLGDQWLRAIHPEDRPRSWDLWTRFIQGKSDYDLEYRLRRADGAYRWFKTRSIPIHDERGRTVKIFGSCTDIDDKIRAEESLREVGAELQRSNRELEQFAYIVSHDLREPLRTIAGFLNLVRKKSEGRLDPEAGEFIGYAVEGADRLDRMIHNLLDYSRIQRQEITLRPVPLFDIWVDVIENLRFLIQETGAHITHDQLPVVRGDPGQLVRLLQNLIGNAITYCRGRKPEIHIGIAPEGDRWRIVVQDNGIGIPPEHQDRIFQIFQRLHTQKEYPGSGIGLAVCQKIVERHGGRIWVESEPGKGSTFYFTLLKAGGAA